MAGQTHSGLERLRSRLQGELMLAGDPAWDRARGAWNLAVDQRPAAVARPVTAEDVAQVLKASADLGLRVATQTTGHNPGPLPSLENVILLKTERMHHVNVDVRRRRARVGGGAVWLEVAEPASRAGMAALAGSSPDVGVAGYTLGGGLSWLGRKYGVAANSVTMMEVVTADGVIRRVDAAHEPELFWGLRGGGGNFGVVTELEFHIHPTPELHAGWLVWPMEDAHHVMEAWCEWLESVPDEVTSILRLLRVPSMPVIPGPLQGRDLVVVEAAMLLPDQAVVELLAPLRRLEPEVDTFARIPPVALSHLHMDPDQPVPAMGDSRLLRQLSPRTLDAIVATAGPGTDSPLVALELRHLGGELGRSHPEGGAVDSLDAGFLLFGAGIPADPDAARAVRSRLDSLFQRIAPWDTGRRYASFVEGPADTRRFYPEGVYRHLTEVKAQYDPDGLILANHPIPSPHDRGNPDRAVPSDQVQTRGPIDGPPSPNP